MRSITTTITWQSSQVKTRMKLELEVSVRLALPHTNMVKKSHAMIAATGMIGAICYILYITFYFVDQLLVSKRTLQVDTYWMRGDKI